MKVKDLVIVKAKGNYFNKSAKIDFIYGGSVCLLDIDFGGRYWNLKDLESIVDLFV